MRAIKTVLLIFLLCFNLPRCHAQTGNLPRDINEAIEYFNTTWNDKQKEEFRKKPERDAVTELHFSVGLWIRNNWIYGNRDKSLNDYFHKLGIPSVDDVSSIILTSFHRKLNNKPINLQKQVEECKAAWKPIIDCERKTKIQAVATYHRFKIGDPVTVLMYVDKSGGENNAVTFACPTVDWKFDPKRDLTINGIIIDKYTINSDSNVFFKIRIDRMHPLDTKVFLKNLKIGDEESLSLDNLLVE